jgi:hypothetical protein
MGLIKAGFFSHLSRIAGVILILFVQLAYRIPSDFGRSMAL